jgi:hypothetical protein
VTAPTPEPAPIFDDQASAALLNMHAFLWRTVLDGAARRSAEAHDGAAAAMQEQLRAQQQAERERLAAAERAAAPHPDRTD